MDLMLYLFQLKNGYIYNRGDSMDRFKLEIKIFHIFNGLAWIVAFVLFTITQQAKPQNIDLFNYGIENKISKLWNMDMLAAGKWVLLILCIVSSISLISNIVMSVDTEKRFSVSQAIVTLITVVFTVFYFSKFGF